VSKYVAVVPNFIDFAAFEKDLVTATRRRGEQISRGG
jgi:hypothetical protein